MRNEGDLLKRFRHGGSPEVLESRQINVRKRHWETRNCPEKVLIFSTNVDVKRSFYVVSDFSDKIPLRVYDRIGRIFTPVRN